MSKDLSTVTQTFLADVRQALGEELEAVVLFGSAASGRHVPGRSDVNFLVVAKRIGLAQLDALAARSKDWPRLKIAPPLVVEPAFLRGSADSYPLEILGMLAAYQVLLGSDPLEGILPEAVHVRLQAEREVKAKLLWLRRGYIERRGDPRRLVGLVIEALPAIEAILRGLVFLGGGSWKRSGRDLHREGTDRFGLDATCLAAIADARAGLTGPDRAQTFVLYGQVLDLLSSLAVAVEQTADSTSTPAS
jgi:hypothetical protein